MATYCNPVCDTPPLPAFPLFLLVQGDIAGSDLIGPLRMVKNPCVSMQYITNPCFNGAGGIAIPRNAG